MVKVSVIIPVYNVERYLKPCLNSVINQTLKEIEIICVNDGSKDHSLQILHEFAKNDRRIIVIDQKNKGVAVARNIGIEKATGEYLTFVDSDDTIDENCLLETYQVIKNTQADILCFGVNEVTDHVFFPRRNRSLLEKLDSQKLDIIARFLDNIFGKLFKRTFIMEHNIRFQAGVKTCEDGLFCLQCFFKKPRWYGLKRNFYHYLMSRTTSAINNGSNIVKTDIEAFKVLLDLQDFQESDKAFKIIALNKMLGGLQYWGNQICDKRYRLKYAFEINVFKKHLFQKVDNEILKDCSNINIFKKLHPIKILLGKIFSIRYEYGYHHRYKQLSILGLNFNLNAQLLKEQANQIKVSIIIPVYNVENYLQECLDSVTNQTLKEIEIICVNDASTDNSLAVLKKYLALDKQMTVISHSYRQGIGSARNTGLQYASGEYILFLDADDYLLDQAAVEKLYNKALETKAQIVFSKTEVFTTSQNEKLKKRTERLSQYCNYHHNEDVYHVSHQNFKNTLENYPAVAWGKLFLTQFLREQQLTFITMNIFHEDNGFHIKYLSTMPTIIFSDIPCIKYRVRERSSIDQLDPKTSTKDLQKNVQDALRYIKKHHNLKTAKLLKKEIFSVPEYRI